MERQTARREEIVAAAQRIILRAGPAACTTREVARESELNKGLVYYYFPTAQAIIDAAMEAFAGELRDAIRGGDDPLRSVIARYLAVFEARPGLAQAWFEYLMLAQRADDLAPISSVQDAVLAELTAAVGPTRARVLMSYVLGVLIRGIAQPLTFAALEPELAALETVSPPRADPA